MNTMKVCSGCSINKPISEFYIYKDRGLPYKRCIPCHKEFVLESKGNWKGEPPEHETYVVKQLNSVGIPTLHGRGNQFFKHTDILTWGYIRIEAKLFKPYRNESGFYAGNTHSQIANGWKADVICIVYQKDLYFFEPSHPAFYIDGKLRKKIIYTPMSKRRHITKNRKMLPEDMAIAKYRYELLKPDVPDIFQSKG